ncbi:MAG: hypothetical protein SCH71_02100 [Desulfobulbaceae bacterium]|nr:hypothetical protein [Desulfobulbaceae bacterium]
MQQQKQMEDSFLRAHRNFIDNLNESIELLDKDITETADMKDRCTDEWCNATEHNLDELAKLVFSISEPRWLTQEDSQKIKDLRRRIHDLYSKYKNVRT